MAKQDTNKARDAVLLIVAVVLIALAVWPTAESDPSASNDPTKQLIIPVGDRPVEAPGDKSASGQSTSSAPLLDVDHEYLPLIPGSKWVYKVRGPKPYVMAEEWAMTLLAAPQGDEPGQFKIEYGKSTTTVPVWLDGKLVRFGGMLFVEPIEFLGNEPLELHGEFLPVRERILQDAVWIQDLERNITYSYRDKRGKLHSMPAKAKQRDRAHVKGFENTTVPTGMYRACKVFWLSRLEIDAKGRRVLQDLTAEPYREETMWMVPGIGIVKRRIRYPNYRAAEFSLDLVSYDRPVTPSEKPGAKDEAK